MAAIDTEDFDLTVAALLGASMAISSAILGSVIIQGAKVREKADPEITIAHIRRKPFFRDVIAYLVAICGILVLIWDGSISIYEAVLPLAFYFLYVSLVLYFFPKAETEDISSDSSDNLLAGQNKNYGIVLSHHSLQWILWLFVDSLLVIREQNKEQTWHTEEGAGDPMPGLSWSEFKEESLLGKIQFLGELPFTSLRYLSVPSTNREWSPVRRWFAICCPLGIGFITLITIYDFDWSTNWGFAPCWAWILFLGSLLGFLIYMLTVPHEPPVGLIEKLLGFLAFAGAILWLNLIAEETVAVLESLGTQWGIEAAVLGVTVLAMGNCVGDWIADLTVTKKGQFATAVATCFGSPLFNDVIGLGVALTITCAEAYPDPLQFSSKADILFIYIFILCCLFLNAVVFWYTNFRPPKFYGFILVVVYAIFLAVSVVRLST